MLTAEEFVINMMMFPSKEYSQKIISKFQSLPLEVQMECLNEGRLKHICTAVELAYESQCLPEFKNDVEYVDDVIMNNDAFGFLERDCWSSVSHEDKVAILTDAVNGYPMKREGKDIWFNVKGILYSIIVGDDDAE